MIHTQLKWLSCRHQKYGAFFLALLAIMGVVMGFPAFGSTAAAGSQHPSPASPSLLAPLNQQGPAVQQTSRTFTTVTDWQSGITDGLLVTNNDGGELRLTAERNEGTFLSRPIEMTFPVNALGGYWRADFYRGTEIIFEVRGRPDPPRSLDPTIAPTADEAGWGAWRQLIAGDSVSQAYDGAPAPPDVAAFPSNTRYFQLRVRLTSNVPNASAILSEITLVMLNTVQGPPIPSGLPSMPVVFGPDTLTPKPSVIVRSTWNARRLATSYDYAEPRGIILHQIDMPADVADVLPLLRGVATYQTEVLGWDDMAYHYIIDQAGNLYEGRLGGPTSAVSRLSGGDDAIHIAMVGDVQQPPSEEAHGTLVTLLAWLCQAYDINPHGSHDVAIGDKTTSHDNIAGHQAVAPEAPDPTPPLQTTLPTIRDHASQSIVRARWYFPEGNVSGYRQHLMFYNPSPFPTNAHVILLQEGVDTLFEHTVPITAGGRAGVVVNDLVDASGNPVSSVSAVVDANAPIVAERSMWMGSDISTVSGIDTLSRIWYFAEGSTADTFHTYLILFNPHDKETNVTMSYMKGDGSQADQRVLLQPRQRVVVSVNQFLADVGFGVRIIANRPIAAERTMRFGEGERGIHIGRGITDLSRKWYFAEGTTQEPFDMRLLLLNPNNFPSQTTVTFMTPDGTSLQRHYAIPPTTRLVIDVNEVVPTLGVSTVVDSDRPIAAERALYFDPLSLPGAEEMRASEEMTPTTSTKVGTVSFGATELAYEWQFVYGNTKNAGEFLLFSNPNGGQAKVTVTFLLNDGSRQEEEIVMPARSRYTVAVNDLYPGEGMISAFVRSTQPIVAERTLMVDGGIHGASTSLGVPGKLGGRGN